MRKHSIIGIVAVALMLVTSAFSVRTPSGQIVNNRIKLGQPVSIVGRVVDAQGQPVPKAAVHVLMVGANPSGRRLFYFTDAEGNFSIKGLTPGAYNIFVRKEDDGFPDTEYFFYSSKETSVPQAVVSDDQSPPFVTVRIGPKAGRITGRVVNATTGASIGDATMTFSRPENKYMVLITSPHGADGIGTFNFLLPAAPLRIKVTAPGYVPWNYHSLVSKEQMDLLTLEPGQTIEMVVRMRPVR